MATFRRVCVLLQNIKQLRETTQICRIDSCTSFSTHHALTKSRPSTVGVPAWAKAARKRRAQVLHLEKKKTPEQMQAEQRLAESGGNMADFLTSSRVGVHRPKMPPVENSTKVVHSKNQDMFVFYHPEQSYPVGHTKTVNASDWISTETSSNGQYKDSLSKSEIAEIQSLQNNDPKLWTVEVLSDMFKVKPMTVVLAAPLTTNQQLELEVEQEFQSGLSDYEKKEYDTFKASERRRHLKKINNKEHV